MSPAESQAVKIALVADEQAPAAISAILHARQFDVAEFSDIQTLLEQLTAQPPTALIMAIDETLRLRRQLQPLRSRFPRTPVVVVCSTIQPRGVRSALMAGAAGVVLHDDLDYALLPCLEAARAGQICLPARTSQPLGPLILSAREKQVLALVVMGYMNSEIAGRLFLAESTIKSHLSSAFAKLGVCSRHEAVARILDPQNGLGVGILTLAGEPLETELIQTQ
jgi:DNA-binding NarL/FixJ family response regulator